MPNKNWRLTEKDKEIICLIYTFRMLSALQVATLRATPAAISYYRKRLKLLSEGGYLERKRHSNDSDKWGSFPYTYFISKKSIPIIIETFDLPPDSILYRSKHSKLGVGATRHVLLTNDFAIAVAKQAGDVGYLFDTWIDEKTLNGIESAHKVEITSNAGAKMTKQLIPDGYMKLVDDHEDGFEYHYFIELDLGTEPIKRTDRKASDISLKIKGYVENILSGAYQKRYNSEVPIILFLVKSPARLQNIKSFIESVTAPLNLGQHFWLTTIDNFLDDQKIKDKALLSSPVWYLAEQPEVFTFFDPRIFS